MSKSFMIIGGNFINKGAQAMVYVTVDELKRRYPDCKVHVYTNLNYREKQKQYRFRIYDDLFIQMNTWDKTKYFLIAAAKAVLTRPAALKSFLTYHFYRKKYTAMLDISGYAVSSQWADGGKGVKIYLKNIELARKNGVPVFLLPQSMGPFDFGDVQEEMDRLICENLSYPKKIFIREKEGYEALQQKYGLDNVVFSPDIVLQNGSLQLENVYVKKPELYLPCIETSNNVAIVPNLRNFDQTKKKEDVVLKTYEYLVKAALKKGKNIYLVRHSHEDIIACRKIKEIFKTEQKVHLIEAELNCLEYEAIMDRFDYVIAARFHAIIHAYKRGVPAIVVGWATKYEGLVQLFEQKKYVLDIRDGISDVKAEQLIDEISNVYEEEGVRIMKILKRIQKNNCFNEIEECLNGNLN